MHKIEIILVGVLPFLFVPSLILITNPYISMDVKEGSLNHQHVMFGKLFNFKETMLYFPVASMYFVFLMIGYMILIKQVFECHLNIRGLFDTMQRIKSFMETKHIVLQNQFLFHSLIDKLKSLFQNLQENLHFVKKIAFPN